MDQIDEKAQQRVKVMLEHLNGRITATDAAKALGVSRTAFYEWKDRAMEALLSAMQDRPNGRPEKPKDPEKDKLLGEIDQMEKERRILEDRLRIQEAIRQTFTAMQKDMPSSKKKRDT